MIRILMHRYGIRKTEARKDHKNLKIICQIAFKIAKIILGKVVGF